MRFIAILAAIAVATLAAGCDRHPAKTVQIKSKDGSVTISGNDQHMTMTADDGKTKIEINTNGMGNQKLPAFAPVYPGAQVQSSVAAQAAGGGTFSFVSSDAPEKVVAFYKNSAKSAGLVEKMTMTNDGNVTYMASNGDSKKTLQVIAVKSDTGSQVQVYWAAK